MIKKIKENFHWILIILAALFTFWQLPQTFYQQDEWQSLGQNLALGLDSIISRNLVMLLFGELRPFSFILYQILLGIFKFTVVPSAIFAILFQIINSILLYKLTIQLTKIRIIALFAALFFILNSVSHQAVTWVSAVGTLPAVTFILLSIIAYIHYFETSNRRYILISFIFMVISLYFKGIGIFLFILLPLMSILFKEKSLKIKNIKKIILLNFPFIVFGLIMLSVRLSQVIIHAGNIAGFTGGVGNTRGSEYIQTIILHAILYPLTSLFQIFIPARDIYSFTPMITKMHYRFLVDSPVVNLVAQSIVADMVAILGAFGIMFALGIIVFKSKDKLTKRNIIFALILFLLSFIPYIVLDRDSSYLSSRYFYAGAIGAGIMFGYLIYYLSKINKYAKWLVFVFAFLYLFHHASIVRSDIDHHVDLGNQRKMVLEGVKSLHPELNDKTIFYVTSDKEYYGPITNPFQNGLGYVLEAYYFDSGKIPGEFLSDNFLWDLGAEGYREKGDLGFGYYQDIDKMALDMKEKNLSISTIKAIYIRSSDNKILDITPEITSRISTISGIRK